MIPGKACSNAVNIMYKIIAAITTYSNIINNAVIMVGFILQRHKTQKVLDAKRPGIIPASVMNKQNDTQRL